MDIDAGNFWRCENCFAKDHAKSDHNKKIYLEIFCHYFELLFVFWLEDWKIFSGDFDCGRCKDLFATSGAIRLCENGDNFDCRIGDEGLEWGDGDFRCAKESDFHETSLAD